MQWNSRLFPYPLLARWTDDYGARDFGVNLVGTLTGKRKIVLGIEFRNDSEFLARLIEREKAQYALVITCPATAAREVITSPFPDRMDAVELDADDYLNELSSIPYIVSTEELSGFISPEHADEFREALPGGFTIPAGGILGAGVVVRTPLEPESNAASVIDLVADGNVSNGQMVVDLESQRIKIALSRQDKARVEALRQKSPHSREMTMLFSSLYLPAVVEAVRNLPDYSADYRWTTVLKNALAKHGIDAESDSLADDAFVHAQRLLESPIGKALIAHADTEDGED